jgi:hypothetical protein
VKCEWCVYRDGKNPEICKTCSLNDTSETITPRRDLQNVDIIKMARELHDKKIEAVKNEIPGLSFCPKCEERSLRFDSTSDYFECLNSKCPLGGKPILQGSELFRQIVLKLLKDGRNFRTS